VGPMLSVVTIAYVLVSKKNSTSAVAWCLLVFFLPLLGPFLFLLFGYQHVNRPLLRKRRHKRLFQRPPSATAQDSMPDGDGVPGRLRYDAMGSHRLHRWRLWQLRQAGGKSSVFLPLSPWRRRIQINMRNHRKILIIDGQVAFTGGLNIGDEYLGKNPRYGF